MSEIEPTANAWCPIHGPIEFTDEDGCCNSCGSTATGDGVDMALSLRTALAAAQAERDAALKSCGSTMIDVAVLSNANTALREQLREIDKALDDKLSAIMLDGTKMTRKEQLEAIIAFDVQVALDPTVSKYAQAQVGAERRRVVAALAAVECGYCIPNNRYGPAVPDPDQPRPDTFWIHQHGETGRTTTCSASALYRWLSREEAAQGEKGAPVNAAPSTSVDSIVRELRRLTDDERLEVFGEFCTFCGGVTPDCCCMRDD